MTEGGDHITYLNQGECRISADPAEQLSTILGSCVAACIWDPQARVGGMNHFLLPFGNDTSIDGSLRYGANSMEELINGLLSQNASRGRLLGKLFGGATMSNSLGRIGLENAAFARDFLANEDIPCEAEDLGGSFARRVIFSPTTGRARVMQVRASAITSPVGMPEPESDRRDTDPVPVPMARDTAAQQIQADGDATRPGPPPEPDRHAGADQSDPMQDQDCRRPR